MTPEQKKLLNIFILGFAFMFMFTAFQTCGNVAQTVISSLNNTEFQGSGYTSMAIIYGVFSASNLIAPSVVALIGCQLSMFLSGIFYSAYIAMFIQPYTWSFYTLSVLIGIAAAVLWTAQGTCLTINSDDKTIGRNSGIFWALLQFSMLFGNLYIYVAWKGEASISGTLCVQCDERLLLLLAAGSMRKVLSMFCSFLLGLGDSCFNTQLLSILGTLYADDSAPAFAIFKFVQSISAAVAFFYSNYLLLQWQLLVMVIFGFFGTISFFFVEWGTGSLDPRETRYGSI
ncbi:UNC93-like protein MFSD11 [Mantella aurantiaca]